MSLYTIRLVDPGTKSVTYCKEVSKSKSNILELLQGLTWVSIERGIVPNECPVCRSYTLVNDGKFLVLHHWGTYKKLTSIEKGLYRRICRYCNSYISMHLDLDWLYSAEATWEEQFNCLRKRCTSNRRIFPNFDGKEGYWSKFLSREFSVLEELMIEGRYSRTKKSLEKAMKVAQRELPDDKLKVEVLDSLITLLDKVGGKDGREPSA